MDLAEFTGEYFRGLAQKGAAAGFDPQELMEVVMLGVEAMVKNDGSRTNEQVFWDLFTARLGGKREDHIEVFDEFYRKDFPKIERVVEPTPLARQAVQVLKEKGYRLVLATNPIFPRIATLERMRWAGLNPEDFDLITTYENSRFAKPNLDYYREILTALGLEPRECLMVGNDAEEDLPAATLGLEVFLVTDNLINPGGKDLSAVRQGDRAALLDYVGKLPNLNC